MPRPFFWVKPAARPAIIPRGPKKIRQRSAACGLYHVLAARKERVSVPTGPSRLFSLCPGLCYFRMKVVPQLPHLILAPALAVGGKLRLVLHFGHST